MKRKIIVGNWKMNPTSLKDAQNVFNRIKKTALNLDSTQVVMCPPFVYISKFLPTKSRVKVKPSISIGAQNVFYEPHGAFTGEISAIMLKDLGVSHIVIGHSERRAMGETDEVISKKVLAVLEAGIHPILCVGESVRDSHALYLDTLKNQIKNSLAKVPKRLLGHIIVAYEPIWAIGAKEAMDTRIIEETTIFIRKVLSDMSDPDNALGTPILYGGSINFRNAPDIIIQGKVDGLLVGRESVNIPSFIELLKAVDAL